MNFTLRLLIFLMAFQLEVRVRAAESLSSPENCFGHSVPCSFKISEDRWNFETGKVKLHAGAGSVLEQVSKANEWRLIDGALWVESAIPALKVQIPTANIEGGGGQYWVLRQEGRFLVRNISAMVTVNFKDQTRLEVPKGFEVWVGAVNSKAQVEHGMVEPVDLKDHLKQWYTLYPGTRRQFKSEVQDLKDQWIDLVERSGDLYKSVIERKMASLDEQKRQHLEAEKKREQERLRLRREYEKRVFEN